MEKIRGLYEGAEWDASRQAVESGSGVRQFDDWFRFPSYNIAVAPKVNTTAFLGENHRILVIPVSYYRDLWVYFRIEPDDEACTLLWVQERKHGLELRAG